MKIAFVLSTISQILQGEIGRDEKTLKTHNAMIKDV